MGKDQNIQILSDRDHVLKRSGVYVGAIAPEKQVFWIPENGKFVKKEIEYSPAQFKIFCEILDNSVDEKIKGFCDHIKIVIDCDSGFYTIADNGRGIPLEIHKEAKKHTPEVVFTQLRSGSNFDDNDRSSIGLNGMGAALATIFSEKLLVEIRRDKKIYQQVFEKNMEKIGEPSISKNDKQKGTGTIVKFKPDPKIFKGEIPFELINKRCIELTYMYPDLKIDLEVHCNDIFSEDKKEFSYSNKNFEDLIKMFGMKYSIFEDKKAQIKMAICHNTATDQFEQFSNINGADTFRGGTHIDVLKEMFCEDIKEKIKKEFKLDVTNSDVCKHIMLIVFQNWNAPQFEGQTKEKFVNDKIKVKEFYEPVFSTRRRNMMIDEIPDIKQGIVDDVNLKNGRKELSELAKSQKALDKKKIAKLIEASGRDRLKCSLYITEGDSAISNLATVRDSKTMAGLPLRGKVKNVHECSAKEVVENEEIQSIMSSIGLKIGTSPLVVHSSKVDECNLNYGKIVIATDQDMDGYSIRCLLINFLFKFWPEIIEHGYVYILETPLYEVMDKKTENCSYFYNKEDFEKHMEGKHSNSSKYEISYFKGLGSCGREAWDYMINKNPNIIQVTTTNVKESAEKLKMAFGDDSESRKKWLT